jgi:hypothetical protein
MTCTKCTRPIERGETYVAEQRNRERVGRFGGITVKDSELIAAYHEACAPEETKRAR